MLAVVMVLVACTTSPPTHINNACAIFKEKPKWYKAAAKSRERWGTPIGVQMAIIYQESRYQADAKPPRKRFLGIPTFRPSDAYGYGQAKDATWAWYQKQTGRHGADRDDFADAVDFIGWYTNYSQKKLGISKWDGKNQYLAYHEGHGGYARKTYLKKAWLLKVAAGVGQRGQRYNQQLKNCEPELKEEASSWFF